MKRVLDWYKRKNSGPHLSFLTNLNLTYEKIDQALLELSLELTLDC